MEANKGGQWYWYISKKTEIFCDLDSASALGRCVGVLRRVIRRGYLPIKAVYLYPSNSAFKYHVVIHLGRALSRQHRALWALWLGSDKVRGIYTLRRMGLGVQSADILIRRQPIYRKPDAVCSCAEKHKPVRVTKHCAVMNKLLGPDIAVAEFFPRNRDRRRHGGKRLPWGKVPLSAILRS
jgi:hypothetical protein